MKVKLNHKKNKKVEIEDVTQEVGIYDDFAIYDKKPEKEDKKESNLNTIKEQQTEKGSEKEDEFKDWVQLDNPFRKKGYKKKEKSRFVDWFKEIENENKKQSPLDSKEEEYSNSTIKKSESLNQISSINSNSQLTYQSTGMSSKELETSLNESSLFESISSINQINESNKKEESTEKIDEKNLILDINKVISMEDKRTTIMIKNIPNKFNKDLLLSIINQNFKGTYDLFILPTDANKYKNFGYAFINFTCCYYIPYFYYMFNGKMWFNTNSKKVCELTYSKVQEKENLLKHYPIKIIHYNEEAFNVTPEQKYIIPNVYKLIFNKYFPKEQIEEFKYYFITKMPRQN